MTATTETTASSYLTLTEDQELEAEITRKNASTGQLEAATGLTSVSFVIAATRGGAPIGTLTFAASERGTLGLYYAIADTATLVSQLPEATYPDGSIVWQGLERTGDIEKRWWRKRVRRHREGDG